MRVILPLMVALFLPAARGGAQEKEGGGPGEETLLEPVEVVSPEPAGRDRTQGETVVTGEDLRNSSRASTFEALAQESADIYVPGRGAMHGVANGASGGIRIRGLGGSPNSQVLVVEDGVPDYQGIFGHPIPDAYLPFLLDDVLVVKGGDSVLYGTNAMGGVVVLRSRWLDREGFKLRNDVACGSYSTLRETVSMLGRLGSWDTAAAFHGLSTEGHRAGADGGVIAGSGAVRYRFASDLRLTIRNKVVHLQGADPGPASHPHPDHWYDVWRDNGSMQLDWTGETVRLTVTPYFNIGVHRLFDGFDSTDYLTGGTAEALIKPHRVTQILLGLGGEHIGGEVANRISGEWPGVSPLTNLSLYHQLTLRPHDRLRLVVGAREFYSTGYGFVFLYKGGARWQLFDGVYLRTRAARNFRQPTLRELYLPFPTANPDLRPEHSLNWDFGAGWESSHVELSCSGYRTEARDLIKYFGAWPSAEVVNIDHIVIWGIEGLIGLRRLGPASVFLTGNLQGVGRYTRQNPSAKVNFAVEAEHDFGRHRVGGGVSGEWVHGLYGANYSRQPIDDIFAADLTVRYRYTAAADGLSLEPYLQLRNFLDRSYAHVADYPMPGFNFLVGLQVEN